MLSFVSEGWEVKYFVGEIASPEGWEVKYFVGEIASLEGWEVKYFVGEIASPEGHRVELREGQKLSIWREDAFGARSYCLRCLVCSLNLDICKFKCILTLPVPQHG